jgi:nitrite reductase/ring-hydroxylating ferredoxin subunit
MDLPASVTALGEQLCGAGEITPSPALFLDAEVFAAERERIFVRPWMAVDHETRLTEDGRWFRFAVATRSMLVTRESGGCLHALRNVCIHAGYPVCDAEEGAAERMICPYHGWEFALDGRLVEPELSSRIDPSRLRLTSYRVGVRNGLIFVDPSGGTDAAEADADAVPAWLADARVARRARYSTTWNWKFVHHFLQSSPQLFVEDSPDDHVEFGPLSSMIVGPEQAALLRVIPKFAERTDFQVIQMVAKDAPEEPAGTATPDPIAEGLGRADPSARWFDRAVGDWYWSLMSAAG